MNEYISPILGADLDDEPWQFYEFGVFRHPKNHGLYISTDSGCSCPSPWENHSWDNPDDFTGPLTPDQIIEEYTGLVPESLYDESFVRDVKALS